MVKQRHFQNAGLGMLAPFEQQQGGTEYIVLHNKAGLGIASAIGATTNSYGISTTSSEIPCLFSITKTQII